MEKAKKLWWCLGLALVMMSCNAGESDEFIDRMDKEHKGDKPVANASTQADGMSNIAGEEVSYATVDGREITGYLARPEDTEEDGPALIVIHEWWGLNDNIRMMTDRLAGEGYTALAVDLYNGKVADAPDSAGTYARSVEQQQALDNLRQAYAYLAEEQRAQNIGTIGWCFGGGWSLQTALALPEQVDAAVIYYGRLITDAERLAKLQMPVLGIFGAEDSGIPPEQVKRFESALNEAGVTNSIHIYEGADHAFANPSGTRYNKEAAEDAWQKTVAFLARTLKQEP
ncbi:dienelactone hydrolase family protein [Fodinibius sediminis]|uniref:Carboxymethylenebutenolidase n=1 Tax=Fodinibius sediminis TaxID=1214077 RepID=A0A521ED35_9BACT|nr:dienelactone hydrolase family protein [Fodinibius sediminis]SMO81732.1 carboxymethylenebutenolidase [Fodinibius sediminis]